MNKDKMIAILLASAIESFIESLKKRQMSLETTRGYKGDLKQLQNHLSQIKNGPVYVDEITEDDLEAFHQIFIDRGLAPASLRRKLNSTSSFFSFAVRKRWALFNPTEGIERVPIKNQMRSSLDEDEIKLLLDNITHDIIYYFIVMMVNTGIRISECANLTLKDVDLKKGIVSVIEGKGNKDRMVPMNDSLIQLMTYYKSNVRPVTKSLRFFATEKSGGVSPQYVNTLLKQAAKAAGIEKPVTSHSLRHSFASQLVKNKTHVAVIQRLLGHADVRTTSIYMHAHTDDLEDAVSTLSFINEKGGGKDGITT